MNILEENWLSYMLFSYIVEHANKNEAPFKIGESDYKVKIAVGDYEFDPDKFAKFFNERVEEAVNRAASEKLEEFAESLPINEQLGKLQSNLEDLLRDARDQVREEAQQIGVDVSYWE
jgi:hypothetical protein